MRDCRQTLVLAMLCAAAACGGGGGSGSADGTDAPAPRSALALPGDRHTADWGEVHAIDHSSDAPLASVVLP